MQFRNSKSDFLLIGTAVFPKTTGASPITEKSYKARRWAFALLLAVTFSAPAATLAQPTQAAESKSLHWLVAGPFLSTGRNALFQNYLEGTGEEHARAREGEVAACPSSGEVRWQTAIADSNGRVDFSKIWPGQGRTIAYAYTELESHSERFAVATIGSGNSIQARLRGEVIYESRLSRKLEPNKDTLVLRLHKGPNPLLVKVEGESGSWDLQWENHIPPGKVFINSSLTILPDFRIAHRTAAWGQVEVANATETVLPDVRVEVLGDELVFPSESAPTAIVPAAIQRIPFWVASKEPRDEMAMRPIRMRITAGGEEQTIEVVPRIKKSTEFFVTTYRSVIDGSVQPYSVLLPTSFDPLVTYPLIVLLHGANVTGWGQNIISYDPKEWAIQVAVFDRGNNRYRDIGEVDLDEMLADVQRRYRIDPERMYLSGHSMGGYGAWFQATRHPDRWAAISPQSGYTDYFLYHPSMRDERNITEPSFQVPLLKDWSPLTFAENLLYVPAYIVHGTKDNNVPAIHSRKMVARLRELGYSYVYDENPEGGHWWGPRGKYYGIEVVDKPPIWTFFQIHSRRVHLPKRVVYTTDSLRYRKAYWVTIDELEAANQMARIEAQVTGLNTIAVRLSNITQFTLCLANGLVVTDGPITIRVDDRVVFHGPLPLSNRVTLRRQNGRYVQLLNDVDLHRAGQRPTDAVDRLGAELDETGNTTGYVTLHEDRFKKTAKLYGPVVDAFNSSFLYVVGTDGRDAKSRELQEAAHRAAEALAREWMARANGNVQIKTDAQVTQKDIDSYNLILFGNPKINRLLAQINGRLPIRFSATTLVVGKRNLTEKDAGMVLAVPNPLNPNRYVVIVGGTTPHSFEIAARLPVMELPDYVIFDGEALTGNEVHFVSGGFFDKYWRLTDSVPTDGRQ